jgi:IPT/TIG domain
MVSSATVVYGPSFTVGTPPTVSYTNPSSGPVGTVVTITGSYFGATQGSSTVTFNGTAATPTTWSNTSIVAPVPSGATTGKVRVTVNGIVSNGGYGPTFTVGTPPNVAYTNPSSGPVGTSVTITGSYFGATQGSSTVTFNGTAATPTNPYFHPRNLSFRSKPFRMCTYRQTPCFAGF